MKERNRKDHVHTRIEEMKEFKVSNYTSSDLHQTNKERQRKEHMKETKRKDTYTRELHFL